jgi:hypothetical protein
VPCTLAFGSTVFENEEPEAFHFLRLSGASVVGVLFPTGEQNLIWQDSRDGEKEKPLSST